MIMILDSIKDALYLWPEPSWDFLLNLSESDFPILPLEELEEILDANRGFNFLEGQLGNNGTQDFIKNEGFDRVFIECEGRMWNVGKKDIPKGKKKLFWFSSEVD